MQINRRQNALDFLIGFRHQSFALWGGAAIGFVLLIGLLEWAVPRFFFSHVPESVAFLNSRDGKTHIAYQLDRISKSPKRESVYLLGPSAFREGVYSAEQIETTLPPQIHVEKLTTGGQTIAESLQLLERLPEGSGRIVFGVNFIRFSPPLSEYTNVNDRYTLMPPSRSVAQFLRKEGVTTHRDLLWLPGWIRFLKLYFLERGEDLRRFHLAEYPYFDNEYDHLPPVQTSTLERDEKALLEIYQPEFLLNRGLNFRALREFVYLARTKKMDVVLMELPTSPTAIKLNAPIREAYDSFIRKSASELDVPYWNFLSELSLGDESFYDFSHLRPRGRSKFHGLFVQKLASLYPPSGPSTELP